MKEVIIQEVNAFPQKEFAFKGLKRVLQGVAQSWALLSSHPSISSLVSLTHA